MTSDNVYGPREDTYLLSRVTASRLDENDSFLEVGCGSGYISKEMKDKVSNPVVATDISYKSVIQVRDSENEIHGTVGNLCDHFSRSSFDLVVFNPPYLPKGESSSEFDKRALSHQSDLGAIRRFILDSKRVVKPDGECLLLVSSKTGVEDVSKICEDVGYDVSHPVEAKLFFERLVVLSLTS